LPFSVNRVSFAAYVRCVDGTRQYRAVIDDGAEVLRELVRTNDAVVISAIEALLKGAEISHMIADQNISTVEPIGIFPRRILVDEAQFAAARRLLTDAGFANELRPDKG
jgi:hypothetical protein